MILWLFIVFLGISFGAGLYESRVVVPRWISGSAWNADIARRDDPGRRFWAFVTTLPLTLLVFASLALALRSEGELRTWWLAAAIVALAERILTFAYFIPTMVRLTRPTPPPDATKKAARWAAVNYLRHAMVLAAWLLAMNAFRVVGG
jgi:hypothetical protein